MTTLSRSRPKLALVAGVVATAALVAASPAAAQLGTVTWTNNNGTGNFNWDNDTHWGGGFRPEAIADERALIDNGDTVLVTNSVPTPAEVLVGGGSTVQVTSTGNLATADADTASITGEGDIQIGGQIGQGTLVVESGGSISAFRRLQQFGPNETLLELLGAASVSVADEATLDRRTRITGPSVTFTTGSLNMDGATSFEPIITGATHSVIQVAGNAQLDGNLRADLSGAGALSAGQTWDLITAGTVNGSFDSVTETSGALLPGQRLVTQNATSGTTTVQLGLVQQLYLEVNTETRQVAIKNSDSTAVVLDGYTIASNSEHLNPNSWDSLFDQSTPQWIEANITRDRLSEVRVTGTTGVTNATPLLLGGAYAPNPSVLGESITDLTFSYTAPGGTVEGQVIYTGSDFSRTNDITLIIDANGNAQIKNTSSFAVSIDGYQIRTTAGAFDQAGWNSLQEQALESWVEANPTNTQLTEANINDTTSFFAGQAFNIGDLFAGSNVATDLEFFYVVDGQTTLIAGSVVFESLPSLPFGLPGDYNGDNLVNLADYTVWRDNLGGAESTLMGNGDGSGVVDAGDYTRWKNNFGASAGSGALIASWEASAVPEPSSCFFVSIFGMLMHHGLVTRRGMGSSRDA